jgi:phage baseplate assembly protein W
MPYVEVKGEEPIILSLIGSGAKFPWGFDGTGGTSHTAIGTGMDRINQSIRHILSTRVGERFFLPDFGSDLPSLVFEPADYILRQQLYMYTVAALQKWEKRVIVEAVAFDENEFETDQSTIHILIEYRLINSQVRGNYVYPFERGGRPVTESTRQGVF